MTVPDVGVRTPPDLVLENARLRALLERAGIEPDQSTSSSLQGEGDAAPNADPLSRERAFTRLLINSVSEGICAIDPDGRISLCNAPLIRMLGLDGDAQVIGQSLHGLVQRWRPEALRHSAESCPVTLAARSGIGQTVTGEVFYRQDGTSFPFEFRVEPIAVRGEPQGAVCSIVDLTDRQHAAALLRDSQHRLAMALGAAEVGIWDYAPVTGRLQWDDRTRALFGLSPGEAVTLERSLAAIHPGDRSRVERALEEAFDPQGTGRYEVQFRVVGIEDGKERWLSAKGQTTFSGGRAWRFLGATRDVTEEKRAELHLRLMVNELNHRVKNSLAMVQGVAAQTFRPDGDITVARAAFTQRLVALARAHDLLTATNWEGSGLDTVVGLTIASHVGEGSDRFDIDGCAVALSPKAVLSVAMALHELATNAVKSGALSNETGRVAIHWRAVSGPEGRRLRFTWTESGGPVVHPPQRRGFGSKLIERGLAAELQGEVTIEFPESGVVCRMDVPFPSP